MENVECKMNLKEGEKVERVEMVEIP